MAKSDSVKAREIAELIREELKSDYGYGIKLNDIPIPSRFMICGQIITVQQASRGNLLHQSKVGEANVESNVIIVQMDNEAWPRAKEQIELTFFHELIHHILHRMGETELFNNEKFVEAFSGLLHQFYKTATYD